MNSGKLIKFLSFVRAAGMNERGGTKNGGGAKSREINTPPSKEILILAELPRVDLASILRIFVSTDGSSLNRVESSSPWRARK